MLGQKLLSYDWSVSFLHLHVPSGGFETSHCVKIHK